MIAELAAREPASNAGFSRLSLPDSIREVLRARVARLGPAAARRLRLPRSSARSSTSTCWLASPHRPRQCWIS